jgi:uncharacterized membrane protein
LNIEELSDGSHVGAVLGTLLGTTVGGLVALLGGPAAAAVGAASGLALGRFFDIDHLRVGEDFVEDVVRVLTPNKVAVIAEIDEEWTTPSTRAWKRSAERSSVGRSRTCGRRATMKRSLQ